MRLLCFIFALACLSVAAQANESGLVVKASCEQGNVKTSISQCLLRTGVKITVGNVSNMYDSYGLSRGVPISDDFLIEAQNSDRNFTLVVSVYDATGKAIYKAQAGAYEYIRITTDDIAFSQSGQDNTPKYEAVINCIGASRKPEDKQPLLACFMYTELAVGTPEGRKVYKYINMPGTEFVIKLPEHFYIDAQNSGSSWSNLEIKVHKIGAAGFRGDLVYRDMVNNWDVIRASH